MYCTGGGGAGYQSVSSREKAAPAKPLPQKSVPQGGTGTREFRLSLGAVWDGMNHQPIQKQPQEEEAAPAKLLIASDVL